MVKQRQGYTRISAVTAASSQASKSMFIVLKPFPVNTLPIRERALNTSGKRHVAPQFVSFRHSPLSSVSYNMSQVKTLAYKGGNVLLFSVQYMGLQVTPSQG